MGSEGARRSEKILVVDDQPRVVRLVRQVLEAVARKQFRSPLKVLSV